MLKQNLSMVRVKCTKVSGSEFYVWCSYSLPSKLNTDLICLHESLPKKRFTVSMTNCICWEILKLVILSNTNRTPAINKFPIVTAFKIFI